MRAALSARPPQRPVSDFKPIGVKEGSQILVANSSKVLVLAFKINPFKLTNRNADVRYKLPEHIQYLSEGELREDGYDYAKDGQLLLFMVGEDHFQIEPFLDDLFDGPFEDNDLSLATVVGVDRGDGYSVVYPPEFSGKFTLD